MQTEAKVLIKKVLTVLIAIGEDGEKKILFIIQRPVVHCFFDQNQQSKMFFTNLINSLTSIPSAIRVPIGHY